MYWYVNASVLKVKHGTWSADLPGARSVTQHHHNDAHHFRIQHIAGNTSNDHSTHDSLSPRVAPQ